MYYVNQQRISAVKQAKSSVKILINILTIPPQQRHISDHEFAYQFFYNNKILCDIERVKSYNAKQQCIVNLIITTKKPDKNVEVLWNFGERGSNLSASALGPEKNKHSINNEKSEDNCIGEAQPQKKQKDNNLISKLQNGSLIKNNHSQTRYQNIEGGAENVILIDRIVIQQQDEKPEKYYVILYQSKLNEILNKDEKYLRTNIEYLKKYALLAEMKYKQLLHLAYYMESASYKYKQVVYQEGDQADYLYLVEKGQFHYGKKYIKDVNHNDTIHKKLYNDKKKDRPKRYDIKNMHLNPNRVKNSMSIEYKVGVIQGQSGQSFGQQQIINETKRQYSVTCMSTQNYLIKVPKEKYKKVITNSSTHTRMQWMKKENMKKIGFKDQIFNKMVDIKSNYRKYASLIHQDAQHKLNKTQKIRSSNSSNHQYQLYTNKQFGIGEHRLHKNQTNKEGLPKLRSYSMVSDENFIHKKSNKSLERSQVIQEALNQNQNSKSIRRSQQAQENEKNYQKQNAFDLTGVDYPRKIKGKKKKQEGEKPTDLSNLQTPASNSNKSSSNIIFPSINGQKNKPISAHQKVESNIVKNWSASRPMVQLKGLRNKFSGMIDSNALIKQKQEILNSKLMRNKNQRQDIYPLQLSDKNAQKIQLNSILTKNQTRQMRSAAHSKAFMQNLLVQALKKAGYNSDQKSPQSNYTQDTPNSIVDIKNNLRIPKNKVKIDKTKAQNLLEENIFDQCYFKKM